jgi:hypothetical protein
MTNMTILDDDKLIENDEKKLFDQIENLIKQYKYLYKNRMPLLLNPVNENNIQKFVCTTILPTILKNKILLNYLETAEFVFDFVNYKKLDKFYEIPLRINSTKEILETRVGNCFEISTLLVSILIGLGYDAYVVSGYASRELCNADLSFTHYSNPHLFQKELKNDEQNLGTESIEKKCEKIERVFMSKFDESSIKARNDKNQISAQERDNTIRLNDDQLEGLRVHSWVLCLAGKRGLAETLFIETSNGECKKLDEIDNYHGIESLWNNQNYWINFQSCSKGCNNLSFNLEDENKWEKIFLTSKYEEKSENINSEFNNINDVKEKTRSRNIENILKSIWLPQSWVSSLDVKQSDVVNKYPNSQKTLIYYKTIVAKFAPLIQKTNCILKVLTFEDVEMKQLSKSFYKYENRADFLDQRVFDHQKALVTDYYNFGITNGLYAHQYKVNCKTKPGNERIMLFNSQLRIDCLIKREETDLTIKETYLNRSDFLVSRCFLFKSPIKPSNSSLLVNNDYKKTFNKKQFQKEKITREIVQITERYKRNDFKPYDDDIEEIIYNLTKSTIEIKYHRDKNHIIGTFHHFIKPVKYEDIKNGFDEFEFNRTLVKSYYADPFKKIDFNEEKHLKNLLSALIKKEFDARQHLRLVEGENIEIFKQLANNEATNELKANIFGFIPSDEESRMNILNNNAELKNDFIEGYICNSSKLKKKDLKEKCLNDFKNICINRINLLQHKFDHEINLFKSDKNYFDLNRYNLDPVLEVELLAKMDKHVLNIDLLNKRIDNIKRNAQNDFKNLEMKIKTDSRLN